MNNQINFTIDLSYDPVTRFKIKINNSIDKASLTYFAGAIDENADNVIQLLQKYLQDYYPILIQYLKNQ